MLTFSHSTSQLSIYVGKDIYVLSPVLSPVVANNSRTGNFVKDVASSLVGGHGIVELYVAIIIIISVFDECLLSLTHTNIPTHSPHTHGTHT